MKKVLLLVFCFFLSVQVALAQSKVKLAFNQTHIGKNIEAGYQYEWEKHVIQASVKFQLKFLIVDNQNYFFEDRFYPRSWKEIPGLSLGYFRKFKLSNPDFVPFAFYNFQFTNSSTRNVFVLPAGQNPETGELYYSKRVERFGPTIALENYIGIGFYCRVIDRLAIQQKIGTGITFFKNIDDRILISENWEMSMLMYTLGITYSL